VYKHFKNL